MRGSAVAECIHGLDAGLCDQCFPKAVPVLEVDWVAVVPVVEALLGVAVVTLSSVRPEANRPVLKLIRNPPITGI